MSPRTGRPKVGNPKDVRFSIRIDAETNRMLDKYCEMKKINKAEAIRQGIQLLLGKQK